MPAAKQAATKSHFEQICSVGVSIEAAVVAPLTACTTVLET